jgi:SAM-dependent methyltransferase
VTAPPPERCLSVVMPCFNEAGSVKTVVEEVLASPYTAEVVAVDDGSTDGTLEILRSVGDPRVRVVEQGINLGKGAALRRGFAEVTSPFVIVQDADREYDPEDYGEMLGPLLDGSADIVFGSRFSPRPHRVMYYSHAVANRGITLLSNAVTNLNLTDVATGFKAFRREVIQSMELDQDRFGFELEVTAKAAHAQWRVFEVGVSYDGRTYAEGKKVRWTDGVKALYCIARYSGVGLRLTRPRLTSQHFETTTGFDEADEELSASLDNLDDAHNYASWIVELMSPYLRGDIIEIGAGHGTMVERLTPHGSVTASELSERAAQLLRERFAGRPEIQVVEGTAEQVMGTERYDTAVLINVLEHIPDDLGALEAIYEGLRPGGRVAIFVPAHEALYSPFDHQIGHQRRYRRSLLAQTLTRAGFEIDELRYINFPGVLAWFVVARLLKQKPTHSTMATAFDKVAVPVLRRVEKRWSMPIGVSLLAIGRRPER